MFGVMIKESIGMRAAFKVWNFLMIGAAAIALLTALLAAMGITAVTGSGVGFIGILLLLIPLGFTFVMARAGIRGDYGTAAKLGSIIFVLDMMSLFANGKGALCSVIMAAIYVAMAVSLKKNY